MVYKRAAVASTFSPTHMAVLKEAVAFAERCHASLEVLHAAEPDATTSARFEASFRELGMTPGLRWLRGGSPGDALIEGLKAGGNDLLIAGALEREPDIEERAFTGNVARRFLQESPCDLLLLPRPSVEVKPFREAFFAVEPGEEIISFVRETVELLGATVVTLAVVQTPFAAAIAASRGEESVDGGEWTDRVGGELESLGLQVEALPINTNTGFGLCDAVQGSAADVLVVRGTRTAGKIRFPSHLDWLAQVIPTRLLVCCQND